MNDLTCYKIIPDENIVSSGTLSYKDFYLLKKGSEIHLHIENHCEEKTIDWLTSIGDVRAGRQNLGDSMPVEVYRIFETSIRDELIDQYGKTEMNEVFRNAGLRAGMSYARKYLNLELPLNDFLASLQTSLEQLQIGILRMESMNLETGHMILTISEDLDCSGLPVMGETVCHYDEGFISGIFSAYTKKTYSTIEIDCWATGSRVCRFEVKQKDMEE